MDECFEFLHLETIWVNFISNLSHTPSLSPTPLWNKHWLIIFYHLSFFLLIYLSTLILFSFFVLLSSYSWYDSIPLWSYIHTQNDEIYSTYISIILSIIIIRWTIASYPVDSFTHPLIITTHQTFRKSKAKKYISKNLTIFILFSSNSLKRVSLIYINIAVFLPRFWGWMLAVFVRERGAASAALKRSIRRTH